MCICLWPEFDCAEMTLWGWKDVKMQLLAVAQGQRAWRASRVEGGSHLSLICFLVLHWPFLEIWVTTWVRHPFPFPSVHAVFSCVQTMVWLPVFGVLMYRCCMKRLKRRSLGWEKEGRKSLCCITGAFVWRCVLCRWSIARLLRVTFTASRWIRIMSSEIMAIKIDSIPPQVQAIDRNAGSAPVLQVKFREVFLFCFFNSCQLVIRRSTWP